MKERRRKNGEKINQIGFGKKNIACSMTKATISQMKMSQCNIR